MDAAKVKELFGNLKGLFTPANGSQWLNYRATKTVASPANGYTLGATSWEILEEAEALKLYALGLTQQPRLRRRDAFVCSGNVATEEFSLNCLGGMQLDGRCIALNQNLTGPQYLLGRRTLIALNEHTGRAVRIGWKRQDGASYQVCYMLPKPFTIEKHLATCIWVDRVPEDYQGPGYLVVVFELM
jgi:hypothetical protein